MRRLYSVRVAFILALAPAALAAGPERLAVPAAAVVSWSELVELDQKARSLATVEAAPSVQERPRLPRGVAWPGDGAAPAQVEEDDSTVLRGPCPAATQEPMLTSNFLALPDELTSLGRFHIPPDTMGAAGPNHLMTTLNSEVRIQTRAGGVVSTVALSVFFSSVGGNAFDPKVVYDALSNRWLFVALANGRMATSAVYFAISATSDPTGTWRIFSFDADAADTLWADYPTLGVNNTWIVVCANMFTVGANFPADPKMWVIDKSTALGAGALTTTIFPPGFSDRVGFAGVTLMPCVTHDAAQSTLHIVDNSWSDGATGLNLIRLSRLTGTGPAPVWSVPPGSLYGPEAGLFRVATAFNETQIGASQAGDLRRIETNETALVNAVFRNGRIWTTHSGGLPAAGTPDRTAMFWYQINPAGLPNSALTQSGFLDGGSDVHYYFPSIAVNCANDACIGFTRSDSTRFAEGVYCTRLAGDAAGSLRPIRLLKAGEATYFKTLGGTRNRWGDYSATVVDPADDRSFWTIQEYAAPHVGADSRWGTWWGHVEFETLVRGDVNCDGAINFDDIDAFVTALIGQAAYEAAYPGCPYLRADTNNSGAVNFDDIESFVICLIAGACP